MSYLFGILIGLFIVACITGDLMFWVLLIVITVLWLFSDLISHNTSTRKPRRRY